MLLCIAFLDAVILRMCVPALPAIAKSMGSLMKTVQLSTSLFLVGVASSQLTTGYLSDVLGRKKILLFLLPTYVVGVLFSVFYHLPDVVANGSDQC